MAEGDKPKGIHDGHRKRMRQEFLENGVPEDISAHKLLEYLLFYSVPRRDTNELAHRILDKFNGSLVSVFEAPYEELINIDGVSENTAALIKFMIPVIKRYLWEGVNTDDFFKEKEQAAQRLALKFFGETVETVYLLCMDHRGKMLGCPKISSGDEFSVGISPRMVVQEALRKRATAVIIGHNHPGGFPVPSHADIKMTTKIAEALGIVGVRLLDHIIVGNNEVVSLQKSKEYECIFD